MSKLLKNSMLMLIGNFSSKLLVFFLVPFYTSILSTEEYAISDLLVTTINLLYPLFSLMIETAVLRFSLDEMEDHRQVVSTALWLEFAGFLVLAPLSWLLMPLTSLGNYMGYFLLYYAVHSFYMILMNFAKGRNRVSIYAFAGVCNTLTLIVCNVLFLAKFHMGIEGYILAMIIGYAVTSVFLAIGTRAHRYMASPFRLDLSVSKRMIRYSMPLIPNSLSWWVSNSSDRYIMKLFRPTGELGIYSVAYKIPSIMTTVSNIMMSAWEISAVDDFGTEKNRQFFSKMYKNYLEIQVLCCTVIMVLIKPLAYLLFQKDFYAAWIFVPTLLYAGVFSTLSAFLGTIFTAAKKTTSIFTTTMIGAIVNIVLNFVMIPIWGGIGAAVATWIGYLTVYVMRMIKSAGILKLHIDHRDNVLKLLAVGVLAVASCLHTAISVVIAAAILIWDHKFLMETGKMILAKIRAKRPHSN